MSSPIFSVVDKDQLSQNDDEAYPYPNYTISPYHGPYNDLKSFMPISSVDAIQRTWPPPPTPKIPQRPSVVIPGNEARKRFSIHASFLYLKTPPDEQDAESRDLSFHAPENRSHACGWRRKIQRRIRRTIRSLRMSLYRKLKGS
ncbi:hypothetical protein VNI00_004286 [Paramarasmius palmivorus]|uniref:Uncharacterized protein n=1 Tax=Paramarasmius palmivorus TaxID=297713 RepID=A0AAW0DQ36_9AGAR